MPFCLSSCLRAHLPVSMLIFDIFLSACYLSACLPICQLLYAYLHVPTFLFTQCPIALQACQSVNLPVSPFLCPPNCMSASPTSYLSACPYAHLPARYLPLCQPVCRNSLRAHLASANLSVCLPAILPTWCLPTCLSISLQAHLLSVCLS